MCIACGDVSQIPNEIQASSVLIRTLIALPVVGLITLQIKSVIRSAKDLINKRKIDKKDVTISKD